MPAPITARATNPTRHSKGSLLVYSANPPQTPPSTLLVELRTSRRCGTPAAGAGGAGAQDGWSGRGGSSGDGTSEAEGSGNGLTVMAESLSHACAGEHGTRSRRRGSVDSVGHRSHRAPRRPIVRPARGRSLRAADGAPTSGCP